MDEEFDPLQYIASYGDLIEAFGANAEAGTQHYLSNGVAEGRSADDFNEQQYLTNYTDLQNVFGSDGDAATLHYINNGYFEGRSDENPLPVGFDGLQYIASYDDLIDAFGVDRAAGEQHYLAFGQGEGRVTDGFDEFQYLASYGDLIEAFGTNGAAGTEHFIAAGKDEGRLRDDFDEEQYLANYPDVAAAFNNNSDAATLHYIVAGYGEGRSDGPVPVAVDDAVIVGEDSGVTRFGVVGNDASTASGGGALTVAEVDTTGTRGVVDVTRTGRITYEPNGAFETLALGQTATDSFTYTVRNAAGATDIGQVAVTVTGANDAPVAAADVFQISEDAGPQPFEPRSNDSDIDAGARLVVTDIGTRGTAGAVLIRPNGEGVVYDPTGAFTLSEGQTATDTFTYTVADENGAESTATVTMTVTGVGEPPPPPLPGADAFTIGEDSGASAPLVVLGNDTDADGSTTTGLSLIGVDTTGTVGSVETTSRGRVIYDPEGRFESLGQGETVTDSFTYTIQNAAGAQAAATVTMTIEGVNDAPLAVDNRFTIDRDAGIQTFDVLGDDGDVDAGDQLTIVAVSTAAAGTVAIVAEGQELAYTPAADGDAPADIFTYTVNDETGATSRATVTVIFNDPGAAGLAAADFMF